MRAAAILLPAVLLLAGCRAGLPSEAEPVETPVETVPVAPTPPPQPALQVDLQVPATATAAESIAVIYRAEGERLHLLEIDFGDGSTPLFVDGGGRVVLVDTVRYTFAQPGQYTLVGEVLDRERRTARQTRVIRVLP